MPEFNFAKVAEPVLQARKRHYSETEEAEPQPEESKNFRQNFSSTNHQYESYADIVFETDEMFAPIVCEDTDEPDFSKMGGIT